MGETRGAPRVVYLMVWLRLLFAIFGLSIVGYSLGALGLMSMEVRRTILAKDDLLRLARLSLRLFPDRDPPLGDSFWMSPELRGLKEPIDPWGHRYRLVKDGQERFLWVSAGPDGAFLSGDEIVQLVPVGAAQYMEAPPREENSGPTSTGAM
jgi:hypothetical protein